jgi:spermidine/putrescine transport system ATP-binding protein
LATATANDTDFLRLDGLAKRFGEVDAVRSIDLTIAEGEFLTLLGPSGCGKTTLLRMIGGFERPSDGRVLLRGSDLTDATPERRPFNMVFQSYALFPHMSVAENVAYGPRTLGASREEVTRRVDQALELVHLEDLARRPVPELSGGQQQRVALARALVNEPEVLLLDEPLGALDLQLRRRLQDELRSIQRRLGTTFVYVTHDQEEALTLSHRIAVMESGVLAQLSDTREVYESPATRFVAEFVGSANLVGCSVVNDRGGQIEVRFASGNSRELRHHGVDSFGNGEQALAVLRPHHLELGAAEGAPFAGTVTQSVFLGTHARHDIELEDGQTIHVDADPDGAVSNGDRVGVRIKPSHGAVVRDDLKQPNQPLDEDRDKEDSDG